MKRESVVRFCDFSQSEWWAGGASCANRCELGRSNVLATMREHVRRIGPKRCVSGAVRVAAKGVECKR
eukprot:7385712-Prymnesium_polylepis.1